MADLKKKLLSRAQSWVREGEDELQAKTQTLPVENREIDFKNLWLTEGVF